MGCRSGGDPLSLELRMGRSQKSCCAGTLLPQAVLNHVDLVILSPSLKITGPTSIFALCPTAAFAARLYRLSSGCFFLVAGAQIEGPRTVWVSVGCPALVLSSAERLYSEALYPWFSTYPRSCIPLKHLNP